MQAECGCCCNARSCKQGWIRVQGKVHFGFWSVHLCVCECECECVCARAAKEQEGDEKRLRGAAGGGQGLGPPRSLGREQWAL